MTHFARTASIAALLSLTASMSHALTADALWKSWQDAAAAAGLTVTAATQERNGAELRLNTVTFVPTDAAMAAGVTVTLTDLVMTEASDGSVTVVPSDDLTIDVTGAEGTEEGGAVVIGHEAFVMTVTEAGEAMNYVVTADAVVVAGDMATPGYALDPAVPAPLTKQVFSVALAGLDATVDDTPGANRTIAVAVTADQLTYEVTAEDPAMKSKSVQTSTTQEPALNADLTLPATLMLAALTTPQAWSAAFGEGMALAMEATQGEAVVSMKDENEFLPMDMTYTTQPGKTGISVDKDGFVMESTAEGMAVKVITAMLPIPSLDINIGPVEVALSMPLMAAEAAQEFGLLFKLADVTVNEGAWAVIDPAATLPRDPAQLVIDASGTAKLDLFALMAAEAGGMGEVVPPQPETLNISDLTLKIAGAALAGSGAFTFDNTTGTPVPAGEANVSVQGANGLIDKLIALGLVTEQDAGGARMMMSMFMNPASGPDDLTSKIEAKADGSIFVNGQQIQ